MTTAVSVISELIMAITVLCLMSILDKSIYAVGRGRLIISLICVTAIGVYSNTMHPTWSAELQIAVLLVNYFKFVLLASVLYKKINIKIICLSLMFNPLCALFENVIKFIVPAKWAVVTFQIDLSMLLARVTTISLILLFKKKSQKYYFDNILRIFPNYIYILVLIDLFIANGLVTSVNYEFPDAYVKDLIVKALAIALCLCVLTTLVSLLFSVVSKEYYSNINKLLEKQIANQINHYENREKTYADIRRFKHDYTNHIGSIRSLLKAERYDEILEYLGNITEMLPSDKLLFNTGNFISDSILSDKQNSVEKENIILRFEGSIPTLINDTDLCIVLGNAVDNAIEACRSYNGEKIIYIYGGFDHGYFIMTVKNPTAVCEKTGGFLPFTTKTDKYEHGFGLLNIRSVVHKYKGYMKIENKDNVFTLSLTFNSAVSGRVVS